MKFFKSNNIWSNKDDATLLQGYKKERDLKILAVLYGRYMHLVYGVCLKYFKNENDSEDAVMQIFEEISQKLLQHEVANFKSWLHVLSRNYCLMQLRKHKNQDIVLLEDQFVENGTFLHPTEWSIKESSLEQMEKCMDQLNESQKKCITMFYLEEKCYKEIEDLLKIDAMKVKSNIQNGKRNLKICMDKNKQHDI